MFGWRKNIGGEHVCSLNFLTIQTCLLPEISPSKRPRPIFVWPSKRLPPKFKKLANVCYLFWRAMRTLSKSWPKLDICFAAKIFQYVYQNDRLDETSKKVFMTKVGYLFGDREPKFDICLFRDKKFSNTYVKMIVLMRRVKNLSRPRSLAHLFSTSLTVTC